MGLSGPEVMREVEWQQENEIQEWLNSHSNDVGQGLIQLSVGKLV